MSATTERVMERCRALGFALAGVADAAPTQRREELIAWLDAGRHGEMAYLARNLDLLLDPRKVLPGAKSIICVADRYSRGERDPSTQQADAESHISYLTSEISDSKSQADPNSPISNLTSEISDFRSQISDLRPQRPAGRIARYARGSDYHVVMKKRLHAMCDELSRSFPDETFRACVDTAPVLEREYAQRAGLGAVGKHTLLIQPGVGSYLLLGEILTTLPLAPPPASRSLTHHDPCGTCTRCIDACPSEAITPWSVDATRCISYLTIEHRSEIDERYHEAMGDWLFGCDICQEVCPHNQLTRKSRAAPVHEAYSPQRTDFDLLDVLGWDEAARREAFIGSSMKRARLPMMKRNALICAGNALRERDDPALRDRINRIAGDPSEDEMVRRTARTVLAHADSGSSKLTPRRRRR